MSSTGGGTFSRHAAVDLSAADPSRLPERALLNYDADGALSLEDFLNVGERVVVGYHGTSRAAADTILDEGYIPSKSALEWLGEGVYFFVDAPLHAGAWAKQRYGTDAVVLRSEIHLGTCMDRFDREWREHLRAVHEMVIKKHREAGMRLPRQDPSRKIHGVDCAVINFACQLQEDLGLPPIDTVRSTFREGEPLYPDSAFHDEDHVQVCVRRTKSILSTRVHEEK